MASKAQKARSAVAAGVIAGVLDDWTLGDLWEDYPEIGEGDWQAICDLIKKRLIGLRPSEAM